MFIGERCQIGTLLTYPVPILSEGSSHNIQFSSAPVKIFIKSSNNSALSLLTSSFINVKPDSGRNSYNIKANASGLYKITYNILPGVDFAIPEDVPIIVTSSKSKRSSNDYFSKLGLKKGHLGIGCCWKDLALTPYQCASEISLYSSCKWRSDNSTDGVVFLSKYSLYLPLSVAGVQLNDFRSTLSLFPSGDNTNDSCMSCEHNGNIECLPTYSMISYSPVTIGELIKQDSLITTFLDKMSDFLPPWLTISVHHLSQTRPYSLYDYMAFFGTANDLKGVAGCDTFNVQYSNSFLYAVRTTSTVLIIIDSFPVFLYPTTINPFCMVVDLCSEVTTTLNVAIPNALQPSLLVGLPSIQMLLNDNSYLHFKSISFQEYGKQYDLLKDSYFWNGSDFFIPVLPKYDFEMDIVMSRSFSGGSLKVDMEFEGSVLHQSNINEGEVCTYIHF